MPLRVLLISCLALCLVAPAAASADGSLPPVKRMLTAKAKKRSASSVYTAPMSGFVSVRLSGAKRADWDLTLADVASGRKLAVSKSFGSRELAQSWVASGQKLRITGTRTKGSRKRASRARVLVRFADVKPPERTTPSLVRVKRPNATTLQYLEGAGFDVTHNMRAGYADVIVPDGALMRTLEASGIPFTTRTDDLNAFYAKSRAADVRYAARVGESPLPTGRTGYRRPEDFPTELKQIVDEHPAIARAVTIGSSYQGRPIEGVELASDVSAKDDGRPTYFLVSLHHAREWPSAETTMEFAHMLADGYGSDPRITALMKKERIVVVPLINPDGYFASRAAAEDGMFPDPADSTGAPLGDTVEGVAVPFGGNLAYRRKNCHGPVPSFEGERDYPCYYQWGVDPNRNYGEGWGGPGASPDPNTQVFRGEGQWSEPETQAVHEYSQTNPVTSLITVHNVAALVLRPPGRSAAGKAPDEPAMKALGDHMADVTGYTSQYGFELYDTSGTTEDWNYAAAGTYGYTIEMGPEGGQFHMPYETGVVEEWVGPPVDPANPDGPRKGGMREALLLAAEAGASPADHSVLTGAGKAGYTLRLRKDFETKSGHVCTFGQGYVRAGTVPLLDCIAPGEQRTAEDKLEYTTVVPKGNRFTWHVTPSTRPFVGWKYVEGETVERTDTFSGEIAPGGEPTPGNSVEQEFDVTPEDIASHLDIKLDWTSKVEDYDIYLYYVEADGSRTQVGTAMAIAEGVATWTEPGHGQNPNGINEHIELQNPPVGKYVAQIVNSSAVLNDWTLTVARTGKREGHVESTGQRESYTLTCEKPNGQVAGTRSVTVDRGQRLDLGKVCK